MMRMIPSHAVHSRPGICFYIVENLETSNQTRTRSKGAVVHRVGFGRSRAKGTYETRNAR
jgi:hypothetical protein